MQQQSVGLTFGNRTHSLPVQMTEKKKVPYPDFGKRFEEAIRKAALTPAIIARETGSDPETVRLWRRGQRMPKNDKMDILAKLLGRSAAYLRYGQDVPHHTSYAGSPLTITDDDERTLIETYRALPEWAKKAVRARISELLEGFGERSPENPYGKRAKGTQ